MIKLTQEEAREKRLNLWYCKKCRKLVRIDYAYTFDDGIDYEVPHCPICHSYEVVEKSDMETPKEFEARTGRPWDDDSGVYMKIGNNSWRLKPYMCARFDAIFCEKDNVPYKIYCANSDVEIPKENAENL